MKKKFSVFAAVILVIGILLSCTSCTKTGNTDTSITDTSEIEKTTTETAVTELASDPISESASEESERVPIEERTSEPEGEGPAYLTYSHFDIDIPEGWEYKLNGDPGEPCTLSLYNPVGVGTGTFRLSFRKVNENMPTAESHYNYLVRHLNDNCTFDYDTTLFGETVLHISDPREDHSYESYYFFLEDGGIVEIEMDNQYRDDEKYSIEDEEVLSILNSLVLHFDFTAIPDELQYCYLVSENGRLGIENPPDESLNTIEGYAFSTGKANDTQISVVYARATTMASTNSVSVNLTNRTLEETKAFWESSEQYTDIKEVEIAGFTMVTSNYEYPTGVRPGFCFEIDGVSLTVNINWEDGNEELMYKVLEHVLPNIRVLP